MKNPKVSIIIPVYNGSNFVAEAIDSALAQTYKNIEIIVVNDGSTDNGQTAKVAKRYGEKIRYFEKNNGGVATALNLAIEKMTGDYFSWLSHDDVYFPNKIESQIDFINQQKLSDRFILYSDFCFINARGQQTATILLEPISSGIVKELIATSFLSGCSLLVPKVAFEEVGNFNLDLKTTQDYELWFRFVKAGFIFVKSPGVLIKSRQHSGQDSLAKIKFHKNEKENLYFWALKKFTPKQIFGSTENSHLGYLELSSILKAGGYSKSSTLARSIGLKNIGIERYWLLFNYGFCRPIFQFIKKYWASGNRFFGRQAQKHKELFLVVWIILWVGLWCFLVGLYGAQKLLPASWGIKPVQNITNEQGQWNWSIN